MTRFELSVTNGNKFQYEFKILGSQIKQEIKKRLCSSIIALSEMKKKNLPTGKLKFKSFVNSIPLVQPGITYKIHNEKKNYIKIQGVKGYFKVNGLKQIPKDAEFANATLIKHKGSFYINLTTFVEKKEKEFKFKSIGIDFGIKDTITLSNDEKYKIDFKETKRTKKLRKLLSRKQGSAKKSKKSKSYLKNLFLLNKSIEKTNNKKIDAKNKIVSKIVNTYETVCIQDDAIKDWQENGFGKQISGSALGGIKRDLILKSHTLKLVDQYVPTTKTCNRCLKINDISLSQRTYSCSCGYSEDRDLKSAITTELVGLGFLEYNQETKIMIKIDSPYGAYGLKNSGRGDVLCENTSFSMKPEATHPLG